MQVDSLARSRPDLAPSLRMVLARAFAHDGPASRDDLGSTAFAGWAPPELLIAVQALPDRDFHRPDEVAALLLPVVAAR